MSGPGRSGRRRWSHGVPVGDRGPGHSYRPDQRPPSIFGAHQPGIATPQLDHLGFAALDVNIKLRSELRDLLVAWSTEAQRLMTAHHPSVRRERATRRPERVERSVTGLTLTISLGSTLFEREGQDRFGLRAARPVALHELPPFAGDTLDPALCGGDLGVQCCAHDADLARSTLEQLVAASSERVTVRWTQHGRLVRHRGDRSDGTPRDLLGFKDGTSNVRRRSELDRHVWVSGRERGWMLGGTFLVARRIRVRLDAWNDLSVADQEQIIGRHRDTGAPLGCEHEFDRLPLPTSRASAPLLPADSHARLAAPQSNHGATMLRRSYSYDNRSSDGNADADAGLVFLSYQRDPRRQYVPVQRQLAERDALSPFLRHVGSAVFAIPPGARPGGFIADALFATG